MKKLLLSSCLLALFAAASCFAQGGAVSVTVTGATSTCVFNATSLSEDVTLPVTITNVPVAARPTFGAIVVTKLIDKCSPFLFLNLVTAKLVPKVVISLYSTVNEAQGSEVLRLTLTNVFVSHLLDADSAIGPVENVSLLYEAIVYYDPIDNTTVTCSVVRNTCS